jgi:hypothetical protein
LPFADNSNLHGEAWGEPVDPQRHHPAVEVRYPRTRLEAISAL